MLLLGEGSKGNNALSLKVKIVLPNKPKMKFANPFGLTSTYAHITTHRNNIFIEQKQSLLYYSYPTPLRQNQTITHPQLLLFPLVQPAL